MMFLADLFLLLGGSRGTHLRAIFGVFLLRHELAAIDLLLLPLLPLQLLLALLL
jgi:hypothetical protein